MNQTEIQLEAGGLVLAKSKSDAETTEQIVARTYHHPALGKRRVVRLASDRLGKAEDLAMEFLGFEAPDVSEPIGLQQRRSLGFGAWALMNDPKNAQYALDLVKRMKAAARLAKSKPGHAWDAYTEMAKELGRSARQFLPPYWEEAGRAYKDLGNQTYAGRALNKSLEAERVHALASDQARRRDVVLEFVLAGCLAGQALSDYGNDLQTHYKPAEAYTIFRDLCTRRTRGGLSPWATMPREFIKMAKAAGLNADAELETWLDEIIEAPAMARAPQQFWKSCSAHCKRIVSRNPAFAIALLRHTKPETRFYGESPVWAWLDLLEAWGVFEFLWKEGHRDAPPLGEPIAVWFGRIASLQVPAPRRALEMLVQLAPRLKQEAVPLQLILSRYNSPIDIDVLEGCFSLGIAVADPPKNQQFTISFDGWLSSDVDHSLRNQDLLKSWQDERFASHVEAGFQQALRCRGTSAQIRNGQPEMGRRAFPLAANDRPGVKELWRKYTADSIGKLEIAALASFEHTTSDQIDMLWPDALRLFPDLADRYSQVDPVDSLHRTLRAGIFDEYGWPALEELIETSGFKIQTGYNHRNLFLSYPHLILTDSIHAYVIRNGVETRKYELRLPNKVEVTSAYVVGDDLAIEIQDEKYNSKFYWVSDPGNLFDIEGYRSHYGNPINSSTVLPDGTVFFGGNSVRSGEKRLPDCQEYLYDGSRFWRMSFHYDQTLKDHIWKIQEVDSQSGKTIRESVPPWFEEAEGDVVDWKCAQLMPAPAGMNDSPLGIKDGMTGWKPVMRRDGMIQGQGIDGRTIAFLDDGGTQLVGMLRQPAADGFLPIIKSGQARRSDSYHLTDPTGATIVADLELFGLGFAWGQATIVPDQYWHYLRLRDEASSKTLRAISRDACVSLLAESMEDRSGLAEARARDHDTSKYVAPRLSQAVRKLLPTAPERLVTGVVKLVERATREFVAFREHRDKLKTLMAEQGSATASAAADVIDVAASQWSFPTYHISRENTQVSLTAHLTAVGQFLRGESVAGELPLTKFYWFPMLENLPLRCWQTYWQVTANRMQQKASSAPPWLEFLKFWHELGFANLPGRFDLLVGQLKDSPKEDDDDDDDLILNGQSRLIRHGEDYFIVRKPTEYLPTSCYYILRYSTAAEPGNPSGFEIADSYRIHSTYDSDQITQFMSCVESATSLPIPTKAEMTQVAEALSLSTSEIALTWIGGLNINTYQSNFLPAELRQALGLKTTEASAARQVLKNLNQAAQRALFESVIAAGLAVPFAEDRGPALQSIEAAWREALPKRLPVSAEFQKRLAAISGANRWNQQEQEELLSLAADPVNHPLMKPKTTKIIFDKEQSYHRLNIGSATHGEKVLTEDMLRSIVQLVSLVHTETPIGHAARNCISLLIPNLTKLLDSRKTILELANVHIYNHGPNPTATPTTWINANLGKTKIDRQTDIVSYEDDLFMAGCIDAQHHGLIAFHTAGLNDENCLARLRGIQAAISPESYPYRSAVESVCVVKGSGFQKLATAILGDGLEDGQWPENPLWTAHDVLKQIQSKRKLSEQAAILYAQLLALPDPTTANVCKWNEWKSSDYKSAAKELVDRNLALEATRARAGRSIFLPGEWLDLKAPWLPIESWKLIHLYDIELNLGMLAPIGGPLILRPFEDLYAAAWKRVIDGDEPRYEEVQRAVKKSKKK